MSHSRFSGFGKLCIANFLKSFYQGNGNIHCMWSHLVLKVLFTLETTCVEKSEKKFLILFLMPKILFSSNFLFRILASKILLQVNMACWLENFPPTHFLNPYLIENISFYIFLIIIKTFYIIYQKEIFEIFKNIFFV